jgi:formamidopyrimidine-DNA glycosylase
VETIRQGLAGLLALKKIAAIQIQDLRVLQGFDPSGGPRRSVTAEEFCRRLRGQQITDVDRRGKYLLFRLSSHSCLIAHLRMTGQLIYGRPHPKARARIVFESTEDVLNFCDTRRFGELWITEDWRMDPALSSLGPEPLADPVDPYQWGRLLRSSRARIQAALLDQRRLAGLGNIYVTEALFLSGIRPTRRCRTLSQQEISPLLENIRKVLEEGLKHRGVSFNSYRDARGERGRAKERLLVYGRQDKPCLRCGSFLKWIKVNGRGTVYCPKCQR